MSLASVSPIPATEAEQTRPQLLPLGLLLELSDQQARALHVAWQTGQPLGPVTALPSLDREIGGALLPGVHIVHGVPGIGKTAFALQIAAACCCPCLFVTCEMTPLELLRRITARVTNTYLGRFKTGELPPDQAALLARNAVDEVSYLAFLDATNTYASMSEIVSAADLLREHFKQCGSGSEDGDEILQQYQQHLLIVVDSLHSWSAGVGSDATEYDRLGEHLRVLKQIGSTLKCPVLAISERNRQSMERGGLSAGAGHRGIEYGAETVFDLDCDRDVQPDAGGEIKVTLRLQKNRHGAKGNKIDLLFHGALQRYREA